MPSCLLCAVGAEIKDLSLRVLQHKREIWREAGMIGLGDRTVKDAGVVGEKAE